MDLFCVSELLSVDETTMMRQRTDILYKIL
jgi:hypothetical protein